MPSFFRSQINSQHSLRFTLLLLVALTCLGGAVARAQTSDDLSDVEADPIELFKRGQSVHGMGGEENLRTALEFYEQALKLRPEFPEAEYQKGAALVALGQAAAAERSWRQAMQLRPQWSLPLASLGALLVQQNRDAEAEVLLRRALALHADNRTALGALADLRVRAGDQKEALTLLRRLTEGEETSASDWLARAQAERAAGDAASAMKSLSRSLNMDPNLAPAHLLRAEAYLDADDTERAAADLQAAVEATRSNAQMAVHAARLYLRLNRRDAAVETLDKLPDELKKLPEVAALRAELSVADDNSAEAVAALEKLLESQPRNASLHARLGAKYRLTDPQRSLEHYRRALEIESGNSDYAAGYGAALVQARRFAEAVTLLRKVLGTSPDNYAAHANLATALDEMKLYREALAEYNWLNRARPELAVTTYLIARAHDMLGELNEALIFYETFLSKADTQANRMEIERVNLRLPSLRNQIKRGEGVKQKKKG